MRFIFLIFSFCAFLLSAHPEDLNSAIRTYNQAQAGGDLSAKVEAARMLGQAALESPEREDTTILIFEAAQTLALNAAEADALSLVSRLASEPLTEGSPPAQVNVNLLVSYVNWSQSQDDESRQKFDQALSDVALLDPTLLSLFTFQKRYLSDIERGDIRSLTVSSAAAASHLEIVKHILTESWSNAAIMAHSSAFDRYTEEESLFAMAEHLADLRRVHSEMHQTSSDHPEWINQHMALADTWQLAMSSYFESGTKQNKQKKRSREERLEEILAWGDEDRSTHASHDETPESTKPRLCAGSFDMRPPMSYPRSALRQGRVGAVMLSVELRDGEVSNTQVLASIPNKGFADDIIKIVSKWTWVVDDDIDTSSCALDADGMRLPFTFVIE